MSHHVPPDFLRDGRLSSMLIECWNQRVEAAGLRGESWRGGEGEDVRDGVRDGGEGERLRDGGGE